jgi:putative peptidoglycan lipid II flippase
VLGTSAVSDALRASLRIPNFLQNLLGEGVLSASFIPVYVSLKEKKEKSLLASNLFWALLFTTLILTALGMLFPAFFVNLFAPGFSGETKILTQELLVILFPSAGVLVLSAWCLGILNSHKIFFLSYSSPLAWNTCIILTLIYCLTSSDKTQVIYLIAGSFLLGSILQFLVQVPKTLSFIDFYKWSFKDKNFIKVIKNFIPVVMGRGAVQISAYVDTIIASYLVTGSLSVLMYAQTLYLLPISVFAMSISAVDLPSQSERSTQENTEVF